jgi:dTDP-4-dehydrorhamnose 3,5-epimerase
MAFKFTDLSVPGVVLIEPQKFSDDRGFFIERYKTSYFAVHGVSELFNQDNYSVSRRGVVRGMHYQLEPMAQGKLVGVITGSIFDVAVDIRRGSPYFGRWVGETLTGESCNMLWIPPGFAHGFMALEDQTRVTYKTTSEYSPKHDRGILWNDPDLGIVWPKDVAPILSGKDLEHPRLKDAEINFSYV